MRASLTADFLRSLPTGPCEIWDTKLPGLMIRVRDSGRAYWCVVLGRGAGGKETLGRVGLLTPAEARGLAQQILGDAAKDKALGQNPRESRVARRARMNAPTLAAFLTRKYQPWAEANRKSGKTTVARVEAAFKGFLKKPMHELTTFGLESWRTARRRAGVTDATINRDLDALRGVLTKAMDWKVLTAHPMREVKKTKEDAIGRIRYLSPDEEARLRAALEARDESRRDGRRRFNAWRAERGYKTLPDFGVYPDHLAPVVVLGLNTGLRRGELLALRWAEVDLAACRLTVRGDAAKSGLTRHLPLNAQAVKVLRTWKRCSDSGGTLVFPGPTGAQMADLKTAWLKVVKEAKLRDFTFHDLRHTFASKLVQRGVDLNTVRELLGHADIRMTLRYSHLASEHKSAAVAKLLAPGA